MTHPDPDTEAELAAIRERMLMPISREQVVAQALWQAVEIDGRPAQWQDDDWLALARHIIKVVEVACDISTEQVAKAMNSAPRHPLPTLDELGD